MHTQPINTASSKGGFNISEEKLLNQQSFYTQAMRQANEAFKIRFYNTPKLFIMKEKDDFLVRISEEILQIKIN